MAGYVSKCNLRVYYNTVNNNLDTFLLMATVMKVILYHGGKITVFIKIYTHRMSQEVIRKTETI